MAYLGKEVFSFQMASSVETAMSSSQWPNVCRFRISLSRCLIDGLGQQ
ncbi:hypothetical protein DB29_01056 [Shouchella clausii]|nr:hypothetical protein DB29_01056 [Shouchella clausii]